MLCGPFRGPVRVGSWRSLSINLSADAAIFALPGSPFFHLEIGNGRRKGKALALIGGGPQHLAGGRPESRPWLTSHHPLTTGLVSLALVVPFVPQCSGLKSHLQGQPLCPGGCCWGAEQDQLGGERRLHPLRGPWHVGDFCCYLL